MLMRTIGEGQASEHVQFDRTDADLLVLLELEPTWEGRVAEDQVAVFGFQEVYLATRQGITARTDDKSKEIEAALECQKKIAQLTAEDDALLEKGRQSAILSGGITTARKALAVEKAELMREYALHAARQSISFRGEQVLPQLTAIRDAFEAAGAKMPPKASVSPQDAVELGSQVLELDQEVAGFGEQIATIHPLRQYRQTLPA